MVGFAPLSPPYSRFRAVNRLAKLLLAGVAVTGIAAAVITLAPRFLGDTSAPAVQTAGGPPVMRRLTQSQYQHIIADVFGPDIKIGGRFEPDIRDSGLIEVGAGKVSVPASGLEQYGKMARTIAAQVFDKQHRATMITCRPAAVTAPDDACAGQFLAETGRLLYRRPLTDEERTVLVQTAAQATRTMGDFYGGLEITLASMLESPQFLFAWETAKDGAGLDAYSKASRLSFFLWDTAPDIELLDAAQHGDLDHPQGVARQVDRMLASPRLKDGARAFFADMLGFDGFDNLAKDPAIYPKYSFGLAVDAEEQTLRTITDFLLAKGGDYRDLFTTRDTFMSRQLGAVYAIPIVKDAPGMSADGWMPYRFPEGDPRSGILMQVSFLALHSHPGRTSPTLRGKALRETFLCQKVPDPPGNVNFNIVQDTKNPLYKTVRQRLLAHATQATCVGCHKMMDPIGLSLENFDSIGTYRPDENGTAIDASGEIDGVKFTDAQGLGKAIHDHPATAACLVNRLYAYAVGRVPTKSESGWISADLMPAFAGDGYRLAPLMRRIAISPVFFRVVEPPAQGQPTRSASAEGVAR